REGRGSLCRLPIAREGKFRPGWLDRLEFNSAGRQRKLVCQRLLDPIEPKRGEPASIEARAHQPHVLVARRYGKADLGRRPIESYRNDARARGTAVCDPRYHLLPDETALVEIEPSQLVHVGLVGESVAIGEIHSAARD